MKTKILGNDMLCQCDNRLYASIVFILSLIFSFQNNLLLKFISLRRSSRHSLLLVPAMLFFLSTEDTFTLNGTLN